MKMKNLLNIWIIAFGINYGFAQNIGINTANPKSILEIVSSNQGILIPRMTAAQIENINPTNTGELVFSTTTGGATVNSLGFWYYNLGWKPLVTNISLNNNIYQNDGTLLSNRIITQNGSTLNFGNILYFSGSNSTVGINTVTPTRELDVNGTALSNSLIPGGIVESDASGILIANSSSLFYDIGDVKPSYVSSDHDGWYLLDGRNINTLPSAAQNNAVNILGIVTTLPNSSGRYSLGTNLSTGVISGNNSTVLTQANIPNTAFNYTTSAAGAHTHQLTMQYSPAFGTNTPPPGTGVGLFSLGGFVNRDYSESIPSSSHIHTFSAVTGGAASPFNISPTALNANYFVYLGQ